MINYYIASAELDAPCPSALLFLMTKIARKAKAMNPKLTCKL